MRRCRGSTSSCSENHEPGLRARRHLPARVVTRYQRCPFVFALYTGVRGSLDAVDVLKAAEERISFMTLRTCGHGLDCCVCIVHTLGNSLRLLPAPLSVARH